MAEEKQRRWKKILTLVTLVALALLVYFLRDQISETISNLGRVNTWVLLLIIPWQALNHHGYAMVYKSSLAILKSKISYWSIYRVSLELNFVNNVFPSAGVSGFSYFSFRMKHYGVSTGKSTLVQMLRFISVFMSFQVLLLFGLFALAIEGRASNLVILVASSLVTLIFVGTALLVYVVGSRQRIDAFLTGATKFINRAIQVVRPKHPETINIMSARTVFLELHENYLLIQKEYARLKRPFFYALLANVTEIATIYTVYVAFGEYVNIGAVIIAYVVANFAGLISALPGGVGVYEALMTAVLASAGISPAVSIPVTIMYRVLSSMLQLVPGYIFYHQALNTTKKAT
jgi:uncharacterized protein (TIRG00374 family)